MHLSVTFIFSFLSLLLLGKVQAQDKWKLAENIDGIKVYHSTTHSKGFKKIRVEAVVEGTVDKMLQIIKDVPNYKSWVYGHKTGAVLKTINANDFYFYTETAMPWPITNRDAVVRAKVTRDANQTVTVIENSDPDFIPPKTGKIRVPQSLVKWVISPAGANKIRILYHFEADPGGALPPWVVNLFADKGPVESFKKLSVLLKD